jgi:hypothetical protein
MSNSNRNYQTALLADPWNDPLINTVLASYFGRFAQFGADLKVLDEQGKDITAQREIIFRKHTVIAPWRVAMKLQPVAIECDCVTESMCTDVADGSDPKIPAGTKVLIIKDNPYWKPVLQPGYVILRDINNPKDRWGNINLADMLSNGYVPLKDAKGEPLTDPEFGQIYGKPGKCNMVIEVPAGFKVLTEEGWHQNIPAGALLTYGKPQSRGDFYVWSPEVVKTYVTYPEKLPTKPMKENDR